MLHGFCRFLIVAILIMAAPPRSAVAQGALHALVVGVSTYDKLGDDKKLPAAVIDATAVAATLKDLGFTITFGVDLTADQFEELFKEFHEKIQSGDQVALYFSGHGVQLGGENYILLRDTPRPNAAIPGMTLRRRAFVVQELLAAIQSRKPRVAVMILDACRDDPFIEGTKSLSTGGSLALSVPPKGTFMMYAAAAGQTALDHLPPPSNHPDPKTFKDPDQNSLYTRFLLKHMRRQGLIVQELARRVRVDVIQQARDRGHEQRPTYYDDIEGEFCFAGCIVEVASNDDAVQRAKFADEAKTAWEALKEPRSKDTLEAYIARYDATFYSDVARSELAAKAQVVESVRVASVRSAEVQSRVPVSTTTTRGSDPTGLKRPGRRFRDCDGCPELVVVGAGEFTMGSADADNEKPAHTVRFDKPIAVGRLEVTFAEWDACVAAGGCKGKPGDQGWGRGDRPVLNVSWIDAQQYVAWLTTKTNKPYRLLTEAEWEYAARGGTKTPFWTGTTITHQQANFTDPESAAVETVRQITRPQSSPVPGGGPGKSLPAGSFPPNAFGLHDMAGNVAEWVADCYVSGYTGAPNDGGAHVAETCASRSVRGGSWRSAPNALRSSDRIGYRPDFRSQTIGFRVAQTL